MPRKSKAKQEAAEQRDVMPETVSEVQEDVQTEGIQEIPREDTQEKVQEEEKEETTLLQSFFAKIASVPPIRLILFFLTMLYLVKNYMSQTEGYTPPPLPADHEQRMAEQYQKDVEKYWMYAKYITVTGGLYATMLMINLRAERKLREAKQKDLKKEA